jgi:hypothetical protein
MTLFFSLSFLSFTLKKPTLILIVADVLGSILLILIFYLLSFVKVLFVFNSNLQVYDFQFDPFTFDFFFFVFLLEFL